MDFRGALIRLRQNKKQLTKQQLKTLQGQVFAGDIEGAMKGLNKLLARAAAAGTGSSASATRIAAGAGSSASATRVSGRAAAGGQ